MLGVLSYQAAFMLSCWIIILVRGVQLASLRVYQFFYLYILVQVLSLASTLMGAEIWGTVDFKYQILFVSASIMNQLFAALLLIWLGRLAKESRHWKKDLLLWALFFVVSAAMEILLASDGHFVWRSVRAGSLFLFLMAIHVSLRCLLAIEFRMGLNMGVVLAAITLLLSIEGINATLYLTSEWAYENFGNLSEVAGVCAWGAVAWAMFELDPPEKIS